MKKDNILRTKSKRFAVRIINCYKYLTGNNEFVISKQLLRSGTAIGALIAESEYAQSDKDFLSKLYIALKEANETNYWLELLFETQYLQKEEFESICNDCTELLKLLISITKTLKAK